MSKRYRRSSTELVVPDPTGEFHGGLPTYSWGRAPEGLVTRRQLRAAGRSVGGQEPVGQVVYGRYQFAWLYDEARSRPRRVPSPAQLTAVGKALAARRWCPTCRRDVGYCLSTRYGDCVDCMTGTAPVPLGTASSDAGTAPTGTGGSKPADGYRTARYPRRPSGTAGTAGTRPVPDDTNTDRYPARVDRYRRTVGTQLRRVI